MESILSTLFTNKNASPAAEPVEEAQPLYPTPSQIERPRLDKALAVFGLFLMAFTSIVAGALVVISNQKKLLGSENHASAQEKTKAPWHEGWSADMKDTSMRCARLITKNKSIVVFSNGTCVMIEEPVADRLETAKNILLIAADPESKFKANSLPNNDYVITFAPGVFTWVTAKNIATHKNSLLTNWDQGLSEQEHNDLYGRKVPLSTQIGVLARSKMLADASSPKVSKIIAAKQSIPRSPHRIEQVSDKPHSEFNMDLNLTNTNPY